MSLKVRRSELFLCFEGEEINGTGGASGPADNWEHLLDCLKQYPEKAKVRIFVDIYFEDAPRMSQFLIFEENWPLEMPGKIQTIRRLLDAHNMPNDIPVV